MKLSALFLCLVAGGSLVAAPTVSDVVVSSKSNKSTLRIRYQLDEPAVITMDVKVRGVSVGEAALKTIGGEVNALVKAGRHSAYWPLPAGWAAADADVRAEVTVWATNCPPDYMVISLTNADERISYYTSTNAFPRPVTDMMYKTTHLVMRKIPAAGVVWMKGYRVSSNGTSYSGDSDSSYASTFPVMLTRDYYLAIYELTRRQFCIMQGDANLPTLGNQLPAQFRTDMSAVEDLPVGHLSYANLRGNETNLVGGVLALWPVFDHDNRPPCLVRNFGVKYGVAFDIPSDAEWEYACRAGTTGCNYLDGAPSANRQDLGEIAWYAGNSSNETYQSAVPHPVGLKRPNAWGLYDMLGNMYESTADWVPKSVSPRLRAAALQIDPKGPADCEVSSKGRPMVPGSATDYGGELRTMRGGCVASGGDRVKASTIWGNCMRWSNCATGDGESGNSYNARNYAGGVRLYAPAQATR